MLRYKKREKRREMKWKHEEEGGEFGDSGRKCGFTATLTML